MVILFSRIGKAWGWSNFFLFVGSGLLFARLGLSFLFVIQMQMFGWVGSWPYESGAEGTVGLQR